MSTVPSRVESELPANFVPAESLPDYESFITEDDKPADSWYSERQHRLLTDGLHASWKGPGEGRLRCVATDVGLFYSAKEPAVAPDVMVSLDVAPPTEWVQKKNRSYFTWLMGKSPELTVEVVSNLEGGELSEKMDKYARIGVIYYVVWDPEGFLSKTPLQCFALNRKKYAPCEPWFPELELGVTTWDGEYDGITSRWLRFCDRQGTILPTGVERAESAERRAAKMADKLRELGVDPNQV